MAALDTMHTPPSASLGAILSYPGTQAHCSPFPLSTTPERQTPRQFSPNNNSSSSDKENSPARVFQQLSRTGSASPIMQALLQASPSKQYMSFTPQRVRPPPRAWERRPATPYMQRNEGQKIWKRVPLQEIGADLNQQILRREKEEKGNYLRIVKRLRLDNDENSRPEVSCDVINAAIGTKWEEDNIEKGGSPKKKLRAGLRPRFVSPARGISKSTTDLLTEIEQTEDVQIALADDGDIEDGFDWSIQEVGKSLNAVQNVSLPICVPIDEDKTCVKPVLEREDIGASHRDEDTSLENSLCNIQNETASNVADEAVDFATVEVDTNHTDLRSDAQGEQSDASSLEVVSIVNATIAYTKDEAASDVETETSSGSDIWVDTTTEQHETGVHLDIMPAALPVAQPSSVVLVADHEETAFLRDFLQRAQASKAAKNMLSPQKRSAPLLPMVEESQGQLNMERLENAEAVDEIEDDDLSPPLETSSITQMFSADDATPSSPVRRSARTASRTANSRLPRFQVPQASHFNLALPSQNTSLKLPGTIQLKRATGSEFVFNAKSQQTLAMMTRSNTKRNQVDATHVPQRLAQLRKEFEVRQQEGLAAHNALVQDDESSPDTATIAGKEVKSINKRKRDRQDEGKSTKVKRNVKWPSDEQLVRYREPSPFLPDTEASDDGEDLVTSPSPLQENDQSETSSLVAPLASAESSLDGRLPTKSKRDGIEESSKLKVRHIRKIKLDSVNGTPAPKTRSRTVSDSELANSKIPVTSSDKPQSLTSSVRKSSRMPVPVSTPVPLPSLTIVKPKTRSTGVDNDRTKSAIPVVKAASESGMTAVTKSTESAKEVDGRRRLRVRG